MEQSVFRMQYSCQFGIHLTYEGAGKFLKTRGDNIYILVNQLTIKPIVFTYGRDSDVKCWREFTYLNVSEIV